MRGCGISRRAAIGLALSAGVASCAPETPAASRGSAGAHLVLVTSNGWHSGIVLARAQVPLAVIPEVAAFPDASHIEFGWGDAEYYPAPRPTLGLALRAAFPGPALMHVSGLPGHPAQVFPASTVLRLRLDDTQMPRLVAALAASFERAASFDRAGEVRVGTAGIYAFSRFFPATGRFHVFNTCNTWTARILAEAGLPVVPDGVQTADELMRRLRPLAVAE